MNGLKAFQASSIGFIRELSRLLPDARCWVENNMVIGITGWNLSAFNNAIVLDEGQLTEEALDNLTTIFAETGLPFTILIFSREPVPACDSLLKESGYAVLFTDPILSREGPLDTVPRGKTKVEVDIRPVTSEKELDDFREVVVEAFQMPDTFSAERFNELLRIPLNRPMLAWLSDKPVGAGMLLYAEGVAAIFNVATLQPWRRQGIGTEMMLVLHARALQDGYAGTVLAALPEGQALYERLGYHLAGYQISYSPAESVQIFIV